MTLWFLLNIDFRQQTAFNLWYKVNQLLKAIFIVSSYSCFLPNPLKPDEKSKMKM